MKKSPVKGGFTRVPIVKVIPSEQKVSVKHINILDDIPSELISMSTTEHWKTFADNKRASCLRITPTQTGASVQSTQWHDLCTVPAGEQGS